MGVYKIESMGVRRVEGDIQDEGRDSKSEGKKSLRNTEIEIE